MELQYKGGTAHQMRRELGHDADAGRKVKMEGTEVVVVRVRNVGIRSLEILKREFGSSKPVQPPIGSAWCV